MIGIRKKGMLWKEEDQRLYEYVDSLKEQLDYKRGLLDHSLDASDDMHAEVQRAEVLYSFLLREARIRYERKRKH
ncbi:YaaL family protein [Bacillus sp. Marseille-P3800]|uniref:YaaL family protein n=1 Tax=Bacillus sp. Marseille-P3800 TaxID=2014782 RepID=UPI0020FFF6D6|nr:YaaL family protein [Bacillus sp. Marseille-P3800]